MLTAIHDLQTGQRLDAERSFLKALDGSCETTIAGLAELDDGNLRLRGEVLRPDGSEKIAGVVSGSIGDGPEIGIEIARKMLEKAGPTVFEWRSV